MLTFLKELFNKPTPVPVNQHIQSLLKPSTLDPLPQQLILTVDITNLPNNEQHTAILFTGRVSNAITDFANLSHRPNYRIHQIDQLTTTSVTLLLSYQ